MTRIKVSVWEFEPRPTVRARLVSWLRRRLGLSAPQENPEPPKELRR